ncbi:MAG: hypothetical protein V1746_05235 [bacterium]
MNPNIAMGGGGGKNPLAGIDARIIGIILLGIIALAFALIGDKCVFVKKPDSFFESALAWITLVFFKISGERLMSFILTFALYTLIFFLAGFAAFTWLEIHVIEPIVIKTKMKYVRREKKWINKYDDGTI